MVKISELKVSHLRKVIPYYDKNGVRKEIKVFNTTPQNRNNVIDLISKYVDEDGNVSVSAEDMLTKLIPIFTDIEMDIEDISEIIANPPKELVLVNAEINTIASELLVELLLDHESQINSLIVATEQAKVINLMGYLKERQSRLVPRNDFDPLNIEVQEARNKMDVDQLIEKMFYVVKDENTKEEKKEEVIGRPKPKKSRAKKSEVVKTEADTVKVDD